MKSPKLLLFAAALLLVVGLVIVTGKTGNTGDSSGSDGTAASGTAGSTPGGTAGIPGTKSGTRSSSPAAGAGEERKSARPGAADDTGVGGTDVATRSSGTLLQKILEKKREGIAVFDDNYQLNREIAEALDLSDAEYDMLNATLASSLEKIDELRAENVEVRQRSDSQIFLKVRSFAEEGAAVQSSLEDSLRQQLGDARYASFMLMSGDSLTDQYFDFGKAYQTISFNVYDSKNDGARRIRIVDRLHMPQDNGEWAVIENKDNYDSLPAGYEPFFDLANSGAPQPIDPSTLPQPLPPAANPE